MPIAGLTNVPKAFLKLGQIRKGEKDPKTGAPRDLDYFRVTFYESERECADLFNQVYGEKPDSINVRLAFPEVSDVWDANFECYAKGGLIAKASSTQDPATLQEVVKWIFYRDHGTGKVLVRNCFPVGDDGIEFMKQSIDLTKPIYSYKNRNGETVDAFLEPVGRLNVVVPELASLRVGYMEFRPGSTKDISAISRELAAIDHMARQAGKDITGIPMKLTRREEEITKNISGKLSRGPSWLVHIEVGGEWGGKALEYIERKALPEFIDADVLEIEPDPLEEWPEDVFENAEQEDVVPEPVPEPVKEKRLWTVAQKDALIKAGFAKNDFAAKGMLGLSTLPLDATIAEVVAWGKVYRANRVDDKGKANLSAVEAAAIANEQAAP